jgi:ribosomal protein S18 acetylase RimI-like enzyme
MSSDGVALATLRHLALRVAPQAFAMSEVQLADLDDVSWTQLCARTTTGVDAIYVVATDDSLVGMAGCRVDASPKMAHCGMLWGMFVAPSYERHGYGSQLLAALITHGATHGLRMVKLSVTVMQQRAIALYERHGFQRYAYEPALMYIDNTEIDALHMVYRYSNGGTI